MRGAPCISSTPRVPVRQRVHLELRTEWSTDCEFNRDSGDVLRLVHRHQFRSVVAKVFGITKEEAAVTFFRVVQQFRFALMVLNIAPYIALKIMS